ncbi:MAG: hypothetical protein HOW73_42710 [Polyangiaceae bacterium]|nr:hypothetical protein [Polyangiaceae bacterium]
MRRSLPIALFGVLSLLAACAGEETNSGAGGQGGEPTTGGNGGDDAGGGGEGGTGGIEQGGDGGTGGMLEGCAQDCASIDTPECYVGVCNEETHACDIVPAEDGAACEDGEYCTVEDTCMAGTCESGGPRDCAGDGSDECHTTGCDEDEDACVDTPVVNGTPCTSTDPCLSNTGCFNGQCQGAPMDCSATPLDSPECQAAQCDPATGTCVVLPINDGVPCTYGDICQSDKTCDQGVCTGTPIPDCTSCTESEPNNSYTAADTGVGCAAWAGGITVLGDSDCFAVDVTVPGARVLAQVADVNGQGCPLNFDSEIYLYDSTGAELAYDDQGAPGADGCSMFEPSNAGATNLAVGTYYVCVREYFDDEISPPYLLLLGSAGPGCGNQIIENTEECDGAELGGATCVSEGFAGGTLSCNACAMDTTACVNAGCNNGILEFGEDCETGAGCSATCEIFTCPAGQVPFDMSATGLPLNILDNTTINSTIAQPTTGTIKSLGVQLNITHTYDGDLNISLTPPASGAVDLSSGNGGSGENFENTVFSPTGATNITAGSSPYTGIYLPEGNLTVPYNTTANGNWTLTVADVAGGDIGTLNAWRVFGCIQP